MKTILITGTTSGIGKVTAMELAGAGHRVIMANRNRAASDELADRIRTETGNDAVEVLDLDLASLASVRACAQAYLAGNDTLDVLINNAGLMRMQEVITEDGFELQFAVNALAQLALTQALQPALQQAAPSQVIFVTSMMHKFGKLDYDSFTGWENYGGAPAYNQSKLAMMLLARELAEQWQQHGIAVNTLHPGAVNTGILDNYSGFTRFLLRLLFVAPEKGARTTLHLAQSEAADLPTGRYFVNAREAAPHKLVDDADARKKLWDTCTALLDAA